MSPTTRRRVYNPNTQKYELRNTISDVHSDIVTRYDTDSIVYKVVKKFNQRAQVGLSKYGTNLDRDDLSVNDWIQHAQEELMDGILYLEKLKTKCDGK